MQNQFSSLYVVAQLISLPINALHSVTNFLMLHQSLLGAVRNLVASRVYRVYLVITGPGLIKRFRPDLQEKFSGLFNDDTILEYIYHCNAQQPR